MAELPVVPGGAPKLTTPAFPPKYPDPLVPNGKLKKALDKAIAAGPGAGWRVALAIAHLDKPGAHPMAHHKGDRSMFGASMIKVAALYGLCELRQTLREIAKELGSRTSKSELLKDAARYLNPLIMAKVDDLPALKRIKEKKYAHLRHQALPLYTEAFKVTGPKGGPFTVDFADKYALGTAAPKRGGSPKGEIEKMITVSDNTSAGRCVHACGYGYLNGALASAGLFDPGKGVGVWLAGDYVVGTPIPKYEYFRIDSDNDQGVAQASSALHMTRMLALLDDQTLFGKQADGKDTMMTALLKAAVYPEVWIDRDWPVNFVVTHNKLGFADLKKVNDGGANVYSECSILEHSSGKRFALTWLNFLPVADEDVSANHLFNPVAKVVTDTITEYLKP